MHNARGPRRLLIAAIWAMAASTWGSIGHHVFGLPDLGALAPLLAAGVVLGWPLVGFRPGYQQAAPTHADS